MEDLEATQTLVWMTRTLTSAPAPETVATILTGPTTQTTTTTEDTTTTTTSSSRRATPSTQTPDTKKTTIPEILTTTRTVTTIAITVVAVAGHVTRPFLGETRWRLWTDLLSATTTTT